MQYEDLLNVKYKVNGRDLNGMDCYGIVLECCRRSGLNLHDAVYLDDKVPKERITGYVKSLNVREINVPGKNVIVQCVYDGRLHIAFMLDSKLCIHQTYDGVRLTPVSMMREKRYFEVIK